MMLVYLDIRWRVTMPEAIERVERHMIAQALSEAGGNKSEAARRLGVSRRNLLRKIKRYEL